MGHIWPTKMVHKVTGNSPDCTPSTQHHLPSFAYSAIQKRGGKQLGCCHCTDTPQRGTRRTLDSGKAQNPSPSLLLHKFLSDRSWVFCKQSSKDLPQGVLLLKCDHWVGPSPAGVSEPSVSFEMVPEDAMDFHVPATLRQPAGTERSAVRAEHTGLHSTVGDMLCVLLRNGRGLGGQALCPSSPRSGSSPCGQWTKEKTWWPLHHRETAWPKQIQRHPCPLLLNLKQHWSSIFRPLN